MAVDIKVTGELPEKPVIVEAFPSKGYVSTLAASQMIKQLDMQYVGHIESDKLDVVAVVHDGRPMHPIRLYRKDDVVLIFSELMIPLNLVHDFTCALEDWFKELKPRRAILLASVPGVETDKEHEILAVSTDEELKEKIKGLNVKSMDEGVLTGMSSSLIIKCGSNGIPATSLMVETNYIPDVLAAASLLKILQKILGLKVDVEDLTATGKEIEEKFRDTMEQLKKGQEDYKQMHTETSMYR